MNKLSFIVVLPALLLVLGATSTTFYHKYDTNRITFPSLNLTIQDLEETSGNIISLQKDPKGNIESIVSGKWQFNKSDSSASTSDNDKINIEFGANLTAYKLDGISTQKLSLSNFTLTRFNFTDTVAFLDGNVSFSRKGGFVDDTKADNVDIPLHIVISNNLVFHISSPSDLFHKYFQETPVYGKVIYSEAYGRVSSLSVSKQSSGLSPQFVGGPIAVDPNLKVELVTDKIGFPTKMAFLGPGELLVLEKNEGLVKRVLNGVVQNESLLDVPVANGVERGMLGIAVNKTNSNLVHVFLYFTESVKDGDDVSERKIPLGNRLYRYDLVNDRLINPKLILDLPSTPGSAHNGGEILLDGKGYIYLIIGDLNRSNAKNSNSTSNNSAE